MNFIYPNKLKSFTLLELLITIVVSSIIVICCVYIFYGTYFANLNQRKNYSKLEQINYAMEYMENEISNSVETKVDSDGIKIKRYRYNSFISENSNHTISKVNEIAYKKVKYGNKYEIRRISKDILNSTYYGSNLLIKDLDFFNVEKSDDYLILRFSFNSKEYTKYIFLKSKKIEYLTGEN